MSDDLTNVRQEFLTELESILESDEAYGSNIQVLTYSVKDEVINGKFKDLWNNRVYEFVIDLDGISYKPAAKLDSASVDDLPAKFDAYSEGYGSLFKNARLDGKLAGKRTKKPKCGGSAYGCGYGCIGLQKTCRILSSRKKAGTNQGKAIGKERLTKLIDLASKLASTGNAKGSALASATAINISQARAKYIGGGAALMSERAIALQTNQAQPKTGLQIKTQTETLIKKSAETKTSKKGNPPTVKKAPENLSLGANKDMSGFDLKRLDLSDMFLKGGNFSKSNLERSNFSGANLTSANFKESYLRKVNFNQSNIDGADFTGADITDADFTGVNLKNVDLSKAIGYDPSKHKA